MGAALSAVLLTACGIGAAPAPTVTVTAQPSPVAPASPAPAPNDDRSSMNDDDKFLYLMRSNYPWFDDVTDRTLIDLAQTTCDAFDAGVTLDMYAMAAEESGMPIRQAAQLAAASIVVYCPWHEGIAG